MNQADRPSDASGAEKKEVGFASSKAGALLTLPDGRHSYSDPEEEKKAKLVNVSYEQPRLVKQELMEQCDGCCQR